MSTDLHQPEALSLMLADAQDRLVAWLDRGRRALRSLWLCRGRHAYELIFEPTGIFLSCATCRRRTPGWDCRLTPLTGRGYPHGTYRG